MNENVKDSGNNSMSVKSANSSLALVLMALLCSSCLAKSAGSLSATDSRNYTCRELKDLVAERDQLYLSGFLGSKASVYASASSCDFQLERPIASAWRTKDEFSCVVGYRCREVIGLDGFGGTQ